MISLNYVKVFGKIKYFMYLTNSFGKPQPTYMKDFVNIFKTSMVSGAFNNVIEKIDKAELENLWSAILTEVPEAHRDGGYDWYVKMRIIWMRITRHITLR